MAGGQGVGEIVRKGGKLPGHVSVRYPDVFLTVDDRKVTIEIKVSPKKRDLDALSKRRQEHCGIVEGFYLIGGYVATVPIQLRQLETERWGTLFERFSPSGCSKTDQASQGKRCVES